MLSQKILVEFCDIHCKFTIIALDLLPKVKPSLLRRGFALCTGRRFMADSLHQAMRSMSLDDEEPLALPDSPRFRVFDENAVSILGKLSNPESQPMDKMIEYMPTPWRVHERVRGIALSKDRFQFIFEREEDLLTVLRDRPWSYNGWTLFLERWTLNPPEDFLCTLDIWICIRNIPVNHFTTDTMFRLASEIGEVKEIVYDPKVSQTKSIFVPWSVSILQVLPRREENSRFLLEKLSTSNLSMRGYIKSVLTVSASLTRNSDALSCVVALTSQGSRPMFLKHRLLLLRRQSQKNQH